MKIIEKLKDETTLARKIFAEIESDLINGVLKPGQRLPPQDEMAENFGVSRTTLREAFKMLVALGILQVHHGKGTFIAENYTSNFIDSLIFGLIIENKTIRELVELRQMIEIGVLEIVIDKVTEHDIEQMEIALNTLQKCREQNDENLDVLLRLDLNFHYAFARATHNPSVEKLACTVLDVFAAFIKKSIAVERAPLHKNLVEMLKKRNLEGARESIMQSIAEWEQHQGIL